MFSINTFTLGREKYLKKTLKGVEKSFLESIPIEHNIFFCGERPSKEVEKFISELKYAKYINCFFREKRSVGENLNEAKNISKYKFFLKLDDDAELISENVFEHALEIFKQKPLSVFSPFPVGLINNLGGIRGTSHEIIYSEKMDTFYTMRKVNHIGGFCRFCPTDLIKLSNFSNSHNEDTEFSSSFSNNIDFFYLENTIIVEHQESTLGQHARYGENYFKGRF